MRKTVKEVKVYNWGKRQVRIRGEAVNIVAVAIHYKEDGTWSDGPVLYFQCEDRYSNTYMNGVSIETLGNCLRELGYEIVPRTTPCQMLHPVTVEIRGEPQ